MEDSRNNASVERRLKEAMKTDRARIQLGRISPFGLLELSRQRLRPSLLEANFEKCPHCSGVGVIRSIESTALHTLRAVEEEGIRRRSSEITVAVAPRVALYILNTKRVELALIEQRYGLRVLVLADDSLIVPDLRIERVKARLPGDDVPLAITAERAFVEPEPGDDEDEDEAEAVEPAEASDGGRTAGAAVGAAGGEDGRGDRRGGRRSRRGRRRHGAGERPGEPVAAETPRPAAEAAPAAEDEGDEGDEGEESGSAAASAEASTAEGDAAQRKRRRGKRGGRRRGRGRPETGNGEAIAGEQPAAESVYEDAGAPVTVTVTAPHPAPPAPAPRVAGEEEVDFDWFLDGERTSAAAIPVTSSLEVVEVAEAVVASTEGDGVAVGLAEPDGGESPAADGEAPAHEAVAGEASPRKRTRRRAGADSGGEAEAAVVRRTRRRVKMTPNGDSEAPPEIAVEVAPDLAAEVVPEPVPEPEAAPPAEPVPADAEDTAVIAPTEWPAEAPPPPVQIIADAPLPAPTRESVDDGVPAEPRPARRGWWNRG